MPAECHWRVERVSARETYELRQQVLRPHQSVAEVGFAGDDDPDTCHLAVFADAGISPDADNIHAVGVATVMHQCPASRLLAGPTTDPASWWRLRGMATAHHHRNLGVGSALMVAARAHVAAHQGTVLWCHARLPAVDFYRRAGFTAIGDWWDEPGLGRHVVMWRTVPKHPGPPQAP